jgi:MbtH protein
MEQQDNTIYKVVLNQEQQYSIWPAERENAFGWKDAGKIGAKTECLEYVKEVWTDMRPLSLRNGWKSRRAILEPMTLAAAAEMIMGMAGRSRVNFTKGNMT